MVDAKDLKVFKSTQGSSLGGAPSSSIKVTSSTFNNIFSVVNSSEQASGEDYYTCIFWRNGHASEKMDNFRIWLTDKTNREKTEIKWGFEPSVTAINFDGKDDRVDLTLEAGLWNAANTKFSVSCWYYQKGDWDTDYSAIWACQDTHDDCGLQTSPSHPGSIEFFLTGDSYTTYNAFIMPLPAKNSWHHYVCVYDSTATPKTKIYIDGSSSGGTNTDTGATGTISQATKPMVLGASYDTGSGEIKGMIRDFRYWAGTALTSGDAINVWESDSAAPAAGYRLPMNEGTGSPVDSISGTKTGTLRNGAFWTSGEFAPSAQIISSRFVAPTGISWNVLGPEPTTINVNDLHANEYFAMWVWYHVDAGVPSMLDDSELFSFKFDIPQGGTPSTGGGADDDSSGGTGGNPPPTNTDYKIAIAGDWGCDSNTTDAVIKLIKNQAYDYVVGVGDNAYASASCWINRFDDLLPNFNSGYGNHEYEESGGIAPYKTFFGHNKTYFTFKFQNVQFFIFDSNIDMDSGGSQYNTMTNAITKSLTDNTVTWRIAIFHHPFFGASSQHSYNTGNEVNNYHSFFQNNKVQFVVTGHNHNWQMSKQVTYNSGSPTNPNVLDSSSPFDGKAKGIIHVISGMGGRNGPGAKDGSGYSLGGQPSFQLYQNNTHCGVWELVASNNAQTLTCKFRDTGGSTYNTIVVNM